MASFTDTAAIYGLPASTLTDNGSVYTSRFTHGHNDFQRLIASLGGRTPLIDPGFVRVVLEGVFRAYLRVALRPHLPGL